MKIAKFAAWFAISALTASSSAFALDPGQARTAREDTKFLEKVNQSCVDTIDLANLALNKSNNADVTYFAQKMIDDHTRLLGDLSPFDLQAGIQKPAHPDAATLAEEAKLKALTGKDFDKAYIKLMVEDHSQDLKAFMTEYSETQYQAFHDALRPEEEMIRRHLDLINQMAKMEGLPEAPIPAGA